MSTMQKKQTFDGTKLLSVLCPLIYFGSYITRKNYAIVIAEIVAFEGIGEADAALADTLALISYGVGQVISGILGDHFRPKALITCGLTATTAINLCMAIVPDPYIRAVLWCLNGFAQSMLWPPLVRIMAASMNEDAYNKTCVNVNVAGIGGTVFVYLTASLLWIPYFSWKYVFVFSAFLCGIIDVLWIVLSARTPQPGRTLRKKSQAAPTQKLSKKALLHSGILLIAVAIIMQGALRDGVSTWVPSFMMDTFGVDSHNAILKSVLLPIIGMLFLKIAQFVQKKFVSDEIMAASVIFFAGFLFSLALFFVYDKNEFVSLALAAIVTGCMHGVNLFLVCVVPAKFEKYGIVSTMSGIINSLTYVGSALATEGFALTKQYAGWTVTIGSWLLIAGIGILCCLLSYKPWKRFKAI